MRMQILAFAVATALLASSAASAAAVEHGPAWLDRDTPRTATWVAARRRAVLEVMGASPRFAALQAEAATVLTDPSQIGEVTANGDDFHEYHQERDRPFGIWRRTPKADYLAGRPRWTTLLDLDALSATEKRRWFFAGASCRGRRCLVRLSDNGKDAAETREFDLDTGGFVAGGFRMPESRSRSWWYDDDTLLVTPALGRDSVTVSLFPKTLRVWRRGEPLAATRPIFAIGDEDAQLSIQLVRVGGSAGFVVARHLDFERREYRLMTIDGAARSLPLPAYASIMGVHGTRLLLRPNEPWQPVDGGPTFVAGSLVGISLPALMTDAKIADPVLLYTPQGDDAVRGVVVGDRLFVELLHDYFSRIVELRADGSTRTVPLDAGRFISGASWQDGRLLLRQEAPLVPERLLLVDPDTGASTTLAERMPQFRTGDLVTELFQTASRDGTTIGYLVTHRRDLPLDGTAPTLVYGYGGYDMAVTPRYEPVFGKLWLERGGVYVHAYLRGGGEHRAPWHRGAMRRNRQQPFDDMAAILVALQRRRITTPAHSGIMGRSNGGLMVATVMEQRPELMNAVVVGGPLIDMLNYHQLPPGGTWLAEYGDPRDPDMAPYLTSYSPMQNIAGPEVRYPMPLVITSTDDDRVLPGHARRFAARLSDRGHDNLYFEDGQGGHYWELAGGPAPGDWRLRSRARAVEFEYLWQRLGPKDISP